VQTSRDLSAKNFSAEERKYQLEAQTIFFVLDAQNQVSPVQAQISYQRAMAEVDYADGTLLETTRSAWRQACRKRGDARKSGWRNLFLPIHFGHFVHSCQTTQKICKASLHPLEFSSGHPSVT
jgi:hypothetical protein